jgi:hypothetical protein
MTIIAINSDGTMNTERSRITPKEQRLPLSEHYNRLGTPLIKVGQSYFAFSVDPQDTEDQLSTDRDRFKVVKILRSANLQYQTAILCIGGNPPKLAFIVETEEDIDFDPIMEALHDMVRSFGVSEAYGIDSASDVFRDVYPEDATLSPNVAYLGPVMIAERLSEVGKDNMFLFDQLNQQVWFPQIPSWR